MTWTFPLLAGLLAVTLASAWIAGQIRFHFVTIHTEIAIGASKQQVWRALSEFSVYREWNPLMIEVDGDLRPGGRMDWRSRLNGRIRTYNARIDRVEPGRELSWTGPVSSLGRILFWGEHRFIVEEEAEGRVRLINTERFGGLATIVLRGFLQRDVRAAYDAANLALKQRAEQYQGTPAKM